MAVDKRIPRVLNSDVDSKTINKVSMLDALNVYSGPDNEGLSSADGGNIVGDNYKNDSGNGVLKNIRGTEEISLHPGEELPVDCRVIGSVEDVKADITYFFVYSNDADNQGVWAYDKNDVLNTVTPGGQSSSEPFIRLIYKSNQFNFPQNGFVKADIVYSNASKSFPSYMGDDFDKDVIIYFTDGVNEPRKLNAYRVFSEFSGSQAYSNNIYAEADLITACPKTPLKPITFLFESDTTRLASNFIGTQGFQFAYQHIYLDGMETAVSPYSDIAFPPSVLEQGAATYVDHNEFNACRLSIPPSGPEISEVRILCRQGNTGSFQVIEQIQASNTETEYLFYNDRILAGFSNAEINKQFDAVPRRATAQSVTSNRLFYGNYLDGYDNQPITDSVVEVKYFERKEDFKSFNVKLQPSIAPIGTNGAKTSAFVLDCSELEDNVSAGTVVDVKVTLSPDKNWHVYNFSGSDESYHQSTTMGPQDQLSVDTLYNGANELTFFNQSPEEAGSEYLLDNNFPIFGNNDGVGDASNAWVSVGGGADQGVGVAEAGILSNIGYGTSAGNPLVIRGGGLTFRTKLEAAIDIVNARQAIASAINTAFTFQLNPLFPSLTKDVALLSLGFIEIETVSEPEYDFDLALQDGQLITQGFLYQDDPSSDLSKLITAVKKGGEGTNQEGPCGAFIINKGTVKAKAFEADESFIYNDPLKVHIGFTLESLTIDPEVGIFTCIHETPSVQLDDGSTNLPENVAALAWIAINQNTISDQTGGQPFDLSSFLSERGLSIPNGFGNGTAGQSSGNVNTPYRFQVGYISALSNDNIFVAGNFCMLDGEGGPGGSFSRGGSDSENSFDEAFLYQQGSLTVNPQVDGESFFYGSTAFFTGSIVPFKRDEGPGDNIPTCLPLVFSGTGTNADTRYPSVQVDATDDEFISVTSINLKRLHSYTEILAGFASVQPRGGGIYRSFKTDATHDFGVVYYDERGRHGFVNPIPPVYVKGYGDRPTGKEGRVEVEISLNNDPPEWAHNYKIVYAKNTRVKDFIQYSSGGAFIARDEEEQSITQGNTNIYVSLNYLQGHPISYVSSFGARTPEGGLNFYKFEEGDKLKVISYAEGGEREYPKAIEFEVVDQVILGSTDNPLAIEPEENQQGDFVILKNNPNAGKFAFTDVAGGTDAWGDNCIFELRSPYKTRDQESLFYYEISDTFDVVLNPETEAREHGTYPVILNEGDVFFRKVAVNVRDQQATTFPDIIRDDDGESDPSKSNFKSVYLETNTATDLYRSDSIGIGRPNVILEGAKETVREATITYSDPSNPESTKINYASFNPSLANFRDLSERYGSIQYMGDHSDYVVVIQKERITIVPVDKRVLSDASGSEMIIASTTVLNEPIVYPGVSGCDDDPSSVYDSGDQIYFCNKSLSKVYKWTKNGGAEEITAKGMSSFIRACIQKALDSGEVRVVGGYDPLKEEYLLSIQNVFEYGESSNVQPVIQPPAEAPDDGGGPDDNLPSDLPPLVVLPDPIVFNDVQFGPGAQDAAGSNQTVSVLLQANEDLQIESIQFSDDRFTLTTLTGEGSTAFPIAFLPAQGINIYPIAISYSPDTVDEVSAEIEFTTNLESHPSIVFDIDATATFVAGDGQALPDEAFSLAEAFNDYYTQTYTAEDMSAQLAIEYLQALAFSPVEDQPTGNQIKSLLNSVNQNSMKRLVLDTYGDNNNAVGDSTDGIDFINLLGANGVLGDTFDPNISIFQDNETFSPSGEGDSPPPLSNNPPPNFDTVEEAVQYLEQNRVLRVHDIARLNKYSNPNIVLNVVDRFGIQIINSQDLLAVLSAFGTTMNGMDSPYGPNTPTDYDTAEYTGSQVIDQIVTEFYDVITVEQYHRILNDEYPDPNTGLATSGVSPVAAMVASMGAYAGYYGANYDYYCQTPTLLFFLSQFGADNGITLDGLSGNPEIL